MAQGCWTREGPERSQAGQDQWACEDQGPERNQAGQDQWACEDQGPESNQAGQDQCAWREAQRGPKRAGSNSSCRQASHVKLFVPWSPVRWFADMNVVVVSAVMNALVVWWREEHLIGLLLPSIRSSSPSRRERGSLLLFDRSSPQVFSIGAWFPKADLRKNPQC
ncbi:hypothetical protein Q8A73_010903 [Channa argus]|nr:hypothetical protein Q8A73_010903 [Channa argus]